MSHFAQPQPQSDQARDTPEQLPVSIGVFDSGVGGLTVAQAILRRRPDVNLIYFGDSLNLPYGGRMPEQLVRFAHNSIEFLLEKGATVLAVGCNATNCVLGQGDLKSYGIPAFDLVSTTVDWLRVQHLRPHKLGLLGTLATVHSRYWERKLTDAFPEMEVVAAAAPEFVPLIEAGNAPEREIRYAVHARLQPLLDEGVRTILHGCTHYPWLQRYMEEVERDLHFIDPADCLAERLCAALPPARDGSRRGKRQLFNSRPSGLFYRMASEALELDARTATRMYIVNPYEE
jgi:glutamate racemase